VVPALLRGRVFRRYWSASAISMFGDQVSGVALPLAAVLALHAGAAQMGYLTALEWWRARSTATSPLRSTGSPTCCHRGNASGSAGAWPGLLRPEGWLDGWQWFALLEAKHARAMAPSPVSGRVRWE
jgi:hypothetical protein